MITLFLSLLAFGVGLAIGYSVPLYIIPYIQANNFSLSEPSFYVIFIAGSAISVAVSVYAYKKM